MRIGFYIAAAAWLCLPLGAGAWTRAGHMVTAATARRVALAGYRLADVLRQALKGE